MQRYASVLLLFSALLAPSAAFVPPQSSPSSTTPMRMSTQSDSPKKVMSKSMPFLPLILDKQGRPILDGSLAGDVGFDPFGFASTKESLLSARDAEVKHGRLAMLAAVGWPISELLNGKLAHLLGLPVTLAKNGMAPNVLNGGIFSTTYNFALLGGLAIATAVELKSLGDGTQRTMGGGVKLEDVENELGRKYQPGNLGFDPLKLMGQAPASRERMELAEIKHCRLAMIAVTAFAFQEFVSGLPVVDETPGFFKPFFL